MNLSDIKQLLSHEQIQLTKSLGQNFLHDRHQLERIAAAGAITAADRILEIGPGLGPLTRLLLDQAGHVLAVEKDRRLVQVLARQFAGHERLQLIEADALEYLRRERPDLAGWKMVSNLPYSVASPILVELAALEEPPERLVVTLQEEVAHRLVAGPANRDYGVLSLLVQIAYEPVGHFSIPSGCFFPEPNVESACVTLSRRSEPLLRQDERRAFTKIVKRGFSQRRKMMVKLLKADWPLALVQAALDELALDQRIRAEKVSLPQFVQLTRFLLSAVASTSSLPPGNSAEAGE